MKKHSEQAEPVHKHARDIPLGDTFGPRPRQRDNPSHHTGSRFAHSRGWLARLFRRRKKAAPEMENAEHQTLHFHSAAAAHAGHSDHASHGGHALFHVHGPGGHIAVFDDRIEIHRHGLLHILLEILLYYEGSTELTLPIAKITGVSLVEPMVFPGYIRFYFPGSPIYSKDYWTDAMAPNTMLMPYFDHREFHRLRDFILAKQAGK